MVGLESINIVSVTREDFLLYTLAKTVFGHDSNDLAAVLFFGGYPTNHLIHSHKVGANRGVQILGRDHGLTDSFSSLLYFSHRGWVVKNTTGDLAVAATKAKHQMQCRFLLNVVVTQSATILELLSSKDETLLIGWDTLLVLNLGLDVINGIRRLDIEGDGLPGQSFDENLEEKQA
jgi:hypothetical protein